MPPRKDSKPAGLRCAVYTRKSSEEGLEQDFNSLHAQREACEAYIASQKHEGWTLVPSLYDDGGISGGTLERPGLQRLLADIQAKRVDVVVVYKVDRLTRSLADFARLVEVFDAHRVAFVSVTQAFNTTSSMGRLTLNVLLSFAQFEREVTGERIRDKIRASKQKGMWMGGFVPFGYQAQGRTLAIDDREAEVVRALFSLYRELGCVRRVKVEADRQDFRTRIRAHTSGRLEGGKPFSRGHLYRILQNPVYIGQIVHKGEVHPGQHPAIIAQPLWDGVQAQLAANAERPRGRTNTAQPNLLTSLLFDATGQRLTPTHANKQGRRYRYYVSRPLITEAGTPQQGWRLPAQDLEEAVLGLLTRTLNNPIALLDRLVVRDADAIERALGQAPRLAQDLAKGPAERKIAMLKELVARITLSEGELTIELQRDNVHQRLGLPTPTDVLEPLVLTTPLQLRRRGVETRLILPADNTPARKTDPALVKALVRGHAWFQKIASGNVESLTALAEQEGVTRPYVSRMVQLAFLAPDITEAILEGTQPPTLTMQALTSRIELPLDWPAQRTALGF